MPGACSFCQSVIMAAVLPVFGAPCPARGDAEQWELRAVGSSSLTFLSWLDAVDDVGIVSTFRSMISCLELQHQLVSYHPKIQGGWDNRARRPVEKWDIGERGWGRRRFADLQAQPSMAATCALLASPGGLWPTARRSNCMASHPGPGPAPPPHTFAR